MDNGEDVNAVEMNNVNDVCNEEGHEDLDGYESIGEITDDDIRGMEFESEKKAIEFYETYAEYHGFAVRRDEKESDFKGNIVMRQLVCNRQGKRHKKHILRMDRKREPKPITRTGCLARFRVAYNVLTRSWRVAAFESDHNHKLTPQHFVHFIPKYRRLSEADKALADSLHTFGVRTCHILGFMMAQKGGHKGLGFIKKDLYNHFSNGAKAARDKGDAFAALCYLQAKADNDPMFFSKFTTTEDGRLQNLFWSDGTSRFDFECFGDVVAFDTTYKKNRYNKPLVIFSGYNHHGGTTIFGCALVSDEKTETYKWVLNAFSEAMFHKHPKAVVTDGDSAMREAIRVEFPNASHRLCSWHLNNNAVENVKNPKFLEEFNSLIYAHYTPETFEAEWKRVIDDCGVSNNKWVKKVYEMKTMWSSAYMREKFFCGIRTTSLCEGINSLIKGYVEKKNSLVDFMQNFERALKEYRQNELLSDFKSFYYEPVLTNALEGIEIGASKIFTSKKFRDVKNEIEGASALNVIERIELGNNVTLKMNRFCNPNSKFSVCLDKVETKFLCDCRQFERIGIPCSHIICAMRHEHMNVFPESLICKRWTKSAKNDYISSTSFEECDSEKLFMFRRGALSAAFNTLCDISCKHGGSYKEAIEGIRNLCEKLKRRKDVCEKRKRRKDGNDKDMANPLVIGDPLNVKGKGAPRRNNKNKKSRKARRCSHCKALTHTKRKCPDLASRDDLHLVDGEVSSGKSDNESMDFYAADNTCGSKRKRKSDIVALPTQDIASKQVEKEKSSHNLNEDIDSVQLSNEKETADNTCGSKRKGKCGIAALPTQDIASKQVEKDKSSHNLNDDIDSVKLSNGNEAADNICGSKRKRKSGIDALPTQVEKEKSSGPKVKMSGTNVQVSPVATAFAPQNHASNIQSNVMKHGFVFGNPTVRAEGQNATWNCGLGYGSNYFTMHNGVPNQSASIFPQFVANQFASTFPQFFPNQSASIFPQFPRADNFPSHSNSVVYGIAHNVPHHTPFMGALEMECSAAKVDRNACGNEDSRLRNHKQWDKHPK